MQTEREIAEKLLDGLSECLEVMIKGHRSTEHRTFRHFINEMQTLEADALVALTKARPTEQPNWAGLVTL